VKGWRRRREEVELKWNVLIVSVSSSPLLSSLSVVYLTIAPHIPLPHRYWRESPLWLVPLLSFIPPSISSLLPSPNRYSLFKGDMVGQSRGMSGRLGTLLISFHHSHSPLSQSPTSFPLLPPSPPPHYTL